MEKSAGASQTHHPGFRGNDRHLTGSGNVSAVTAEALAQEEECGQGLKSPCSAPYNSRVPGPVGQRAGGWSLPEFQRLGEGKRPPPPPQESSPWRQRMGGRGLMATVPHRWIHLFQLTSWGNTRPSRRVQSSVGS